MKAAVFLDRDNTLIHNDGDLGDPAQVRLIKGAASAIASLRGLGYKIVVVSNQGGVARGRFTEADVDAVNERIAQLVKADTGATIDRFYYCPYHPEGTVEKYRREHPWRKPQPGMLVRAAEELKIDLAQSWMIGDQPRDIQAGAAAGVRTVLLKDPPTADTGHEPGGAEPCFVARSLVEAVKAVAQHRNPDAPVDVGRSQASPHDRKPYDQSKPRHATAAAPSTKAPAMTHTPPAAKTTGPKPPSKITPDKPSPPSKPAGGGAPTAAGPGSAPGDHRPGPALPPPAAGTGSDPILRQILQELRNQRSQHADFSYLTVVAIVLQMVAVVCLLGALWIGGQDTGLYLRWMGASLLLQLATIAMLLFRK